MEAVGKGRGGAKRRLNKGGKVGGGGWDQPTPPASRLARTMPMPSLVTLVPIVKFKLLQEQYPPSSEYY